MNKQPNNTHPFSAYPNELLMQAIRTSSQDTIYFKDLEHRFVWNSLAHAHQFNLDDPGEMLGKTDADFFPEEFASKTREEEKIIMRTRQPLIAKIESWVDFSGRLGWYSAFKYPLYDREDNVIGTWGTTRDITNLKNAEAELERKNRMLRRLSRIDELSGLYNRRYFYEILERQAALYHRSQNSTCVFSLISLDIDHFKTINDTFGHASGDQVISHVADLLVIQSRKSDIVFRIGGDEFMVLLPSTDQAQAFMQAERIRKFIERTPIVFDDKAVRLTVSLGVASYAENPNIESLVHTADDRLYQSKNKGRNCAT